MKFFMKYLSKLKMGVHHSCHSKVMAYKSCFGLNKCLHKVSWKEKEGKWVSTTIKPSCTLNQQRFKSASSNPTLHRLTTKIDDKYVNILVDSRRTDTIINSKMAKLFKAKCPEHTTLSVETVTGT